MNHDQLEDPKCLADTVGKASTDRQYKRFGSTDDNFFWTVGI